MKKSIWIWQLVGFAVTTLSGTLLHFLYDFTGGSALAAPFSGVNESTWEHMKLLLWPLLGFAAVQRVFFRERGDFWCVKLRGILLGLSSIPLLFFTYNGVIGKSPDFVNIAIFFLAAAISLGYELRLFSDGEIPCRRPYLARLFIALIALSFVVFTFAPPEIELFRDPLTGGFGI